MFNQKSLQKAVVTSAGYDAASVDYQIPSFAIKIPNACNKDDHYSLGWDEFPICWDFSASGHQPDDLRQEYKDGLRMENDNNLAKTLQKMAFGFSAFLNNFLKYG